MKAEAELTEEHHEGGETSSVVAQSELRHDQVDRGGEQGATQSRHEAEGEERKLMRILLSNLVKSESAVKSSKVPGQGNDHLSQWRVGVKEEGILEIKRRIFSIMHLVKDNIFWRFESEHSGENPGGE